MPADVSHLVDELRAAGGDTTALEVKSAAGGLPESLTPTLSALANLPGGGTIILRLDERFGFRPVPLPNAQSLKQGLAAKARSFTPPVRLTLDDGIAYGAPVIVARVHECDKSAKPCRVTATGASYLRGYDGDFRLSDIEEQAFIAARRAPMFDRTLVEGATAADLDPELVKAFIEAARERDQQGLGRFVREDELLCRAGVTAVDGRPTVAGLLALGTHPQQWFPRYAIQISADPLPGDPPGSRARNQAVLTGPIPRMLDAAMEWARRTFDTAIVAGPDGTVRDLPVYPLVAFRELVANALIHRDLDHWSAGMAVEIRLRRDRLVIANPGGLYGITVDRLGKEAVTSARNARLVAICQNARSPFSGGRVIEALASGIPTVGAALEEARLPPAHYIDAGIRFVAILHRPVVPTAAADPLNATESRVLDALTQGALTVAQLVDMLDLTAPNIRKALRGLREHGYVRQHGGRGKFTYYERV
ncbi:ATP-binding protein [Microbispora rosea]